MPRNKRDQDREEKRTEIVAAARRLFLQDGFEATTISRLARGAGVTANTIYWYFKDKDEVLVAVLDAEFTARMEEYIRQDFASSAERILWVVNQLQEVSQLVSTVHARLPMAAAVNEWHDRFHALTEGLLRAEMRNAGVAAERIDPLVKISVFTIEGLLSHAVEPAEKARICEALVTQAWAAPG